MFTGIIEEVGRVVSTTPDLRIEANEILKDVKEGASIAVNGVCLTAVRLDGNSFGADVSPETLSRTSLGDLTPNGIVNLERPLAAGERLSGHIVQGHVDNTGEVVALNQRPDGNWWWQVRIPRELERYTIHKGSIAIDGISLTIAELQNDIVSIAIIPHTYQMTNLKTRKPGDRVNIEVDLIAKYVEKLLHRD